MSSLYDLIMEVQKIREAIDSIEVKSVRNASFIVYAYNKCNDIVEVLKRSIDGERVSPKPNQNGEEKEYETDSEPIMEEVGEKNGEPNRAITSCD